MDSGNGKVWVFGAFYLINLLIYLIYFLTAITDDKEKKEKMIELFQSLETPNRLTAIYLVEHLRL